MRELRPIVKCDRCKTEDLPPDIPSAIVDLALPVLEGHARFSGENCASCTDELDEKLTALLAEFLVKEEPQKGRKHRRSSDSVASNDKWPEEDRTCPICVDPMYIGPTRSALTQHLSSKHGKTLTDVGMAKAPANNTKRKRK